MIARPKLAEGVVVRRLASKSESYVMVKESVSGKYFKFEDWEADLLDLLDGTRTPDEIADEFSARQPTHPSSEQDVIDYVESLRGLGLIERSEREKHLVMMERIKETRRRKLWDEEKSTIFQIHVPMFNPDRMFDRVMPWIRWMWSPWFVVPWVLIFVVLFAFLLRNWDLYWAGFFGLWKAAGSSVWNAVGFFFLLAAVSTWHELGHGLTCKRYGGEVRDIGFMIFYFQPAFYCAIDDSYLFPKLSDRLYATFGGPYFELMMAAVATAVWLTSPADAWYHQVAMAVLFISGLSVVVLNFNPLIKLDGYYLLMDWLDVPDLREESFGYLGDLAKKYLLRMPVDERPIPRRRRRIYVVYGVLAIAYTVTLLALIFGFLRHWLVDLTGPVGELIAVAIVAYLMRKTARKFGGFLRQTWLDKREWLKSASGRAVAGVSVLIALIVLGLIPTWTRVDGRFEIAALGRAIVAPVAGGVVKELYVAEGAHVAAQQTLAILESPELGAASTTAAAEQREARREAIGAAVAGDLATSAQEFLRAGAAAGRAGFLATQLATLELRSPISGVVTTPDLENAVGRYLPAGKPLCAVVTVDPVVMEVVVSQRLMEEIHPGLALRAQLAASPFATWRGTVLTMAPQGDPPPAESGERVDLVRQAGLARLRVSVPNADGLLKPGMTGRVQFLTVRRTLVGRLWWNVKRWCQSLVW